jgi:hypothetical protein
MSRSADTVRNWSEIILGQLGNPRVFALDVDEVDDVNALILDSSTVPGSTLRALSEKATGAAESGVLTFVSLHPSGFGSGVRLPGSLPEHQAVLMLAEQLQEEVWESSQGEPVPECPGHRHPAKADAVDEVPSWVCPRTGRVLRPILPADPPA